MNVLITGASSGIGAATALHLDAQGHTVLAGVLDEAEARAALRGASERLSLVRLDVTDPASIASVAAGLLAAGLDAVVNNAGIGVPGPLEAVDPDELRRQLDVNVVGQVAVTQAVLPLLRAAGGRVVFVGSVGGKVASPFAGPYHASKFAMEAIADSWRQELEDEEIDVVLVEPAAVSTAIWDKAVAQLDELLASGAPEVERYHARLESFRDSLRNADDHGMEPQDVAETIEEALTTSSPDPRYVVGAAGKVATALRPFLPDRLADKLAERTASP